MSTFTEKDIPDLTGYVAIVTGGNGGIGAETTKHLALHGARVYIAARSEERVKKAIIELQSSVPKGKSLDLRFLKIDLTDLKTLKAAAKTFMEQEERLDILINNAGIMNAPYKLTVDGYESQWQVNYLAPHTLSVCLMPILLSTAAASGSLDRVRIVNVTSDLAFSGPKVINYEDVNMTNAKGFTPQLARYGHSKQGTIRDAKELNDRYSAQGVTAYATHPGATRTNLQNSDTTFFGKILRTAVSMANSMTPLDCAINSLYLATSPEAPSKAAGKYVVPKTKVDPKANVWLNDSAGNGKLWRLGEEAVAKLP